MGVRVAPIWLVVLVGVTTVVAIASVYAALLWSVRQLALAAAVRRSRAALALASAAVFLAFGAQTWNAGVPRIVAAPVSQTYIRQFQLVAEGLGGSRSLPESPPMATTLEAVEGADVFLVFVEAYGAVSFDREEFARQLSASRAAFLGDVAATGRDVVSAFVESPTFGGSSWLAHLSMLSGIEVRDQHTHARLMSQPRETLVHVFRGHGYRTVALMPGLRQAWPEGTFYNFDEIYGATRLDYRGPQFGWFAVPDQFTLERLESLEPPRPSRPPLFVFFPTISTHFPFTPTPPYQPDWHRMNDAAPFDGQAEEDAYSEQLDWTDFGPGYVRALSYDFATLGGYLRREAGRDLVMIVIGDHQPAAAVSGEGAPWDVPVHIVSSRPALTARLVARGFTPGLTPTRPRLASMSGLLPILLDAFGR
jgi:hypothetical protein